MTRERPFPPPADPERPDVEWALAVWLEWVSDGRPDLDGPAAEQMRIADAVMRGDKRASRQRG